MPYPKTARIFLSPAKTDVEVHRNEHKTCVSLPSEVKAPSDINSAKRPCGKLGQFIELLSASDGATADDLMSITGWQRHTVLGALSRLRGRGFPTTLIEVAGRKAYHLAQLDD